MSTTTSFNSPHSAGSSLDVSEASALSPAPEIFAAPWASSGVDQSDGNSCTTIIARAFVPLVSRRLGHYFAMYSRAPQTQQSIQLILECENTRF